MHIVRDQSLDKQSALGFLTSIDIIQAQISKQNSIEILKCELTWADFITLGNTIKLAEATWPAATVALDHQSLVSLTMSTSYW